MPASVTAYPRVSEWIFIGATAINMAQVASIEFGNAEGHAFAIVRMASFVPARESADLGRTWFEVHNSGIVRQLRAYVDGMAAPALARD
jgi:hypothetical protein